MKAPTSDDGIIYTAPSEEAVEAGLVTVTVTSETTRADDVTNRAKAFLSRVVPWPGDTTPGYVNLHYSIDDPRKPGNKIVTGKPFTTLDGFMNFVSWVQQQPSMKDMWFCTSLQSTAGKTSRGKAKAIRGHLNAMGLKAIWIDIDVKPGQYATLEDALVAFNKFRMDANLPPASALVQSGSGLHAYWLSDRLLIPGIWDAYAHGLRALIIKHGLKCDAGLTTDNVRLLRVPATLNYKTAPPKPVKLLKLLPTDYDFAATQELLALTTLATVPNPSQGALQPAPNQFFDPALFTKPDAAFSALTPEPLMKRDKVNPFPVIKGCKFLRDALLTGGKDYDNPKWNLTTLAAVFMENGDDLAHKMARGHKDYTHDSTEALYQRKVNDQRNRNLGFPKCSTIQASGCGDCASCPFFKNGKSPLNITPAITATVSRSALEVGQQNDPSELLTWPDPLDFQQVPVEEAVARVNAAGYFVLLLNGDIYKTEPGGGVSIQRREGFTTLFSSRHARSDDGKLTSAGTAWKFSPQRREYDCIGYWPADQGRPSRSYNLWRAWGIEPKQGDWSIINDHILDVIAAGDKKKADYILDWSAHMVQRPREKPGVALVLRGRKGTGKTLLTQILKCAIGERNTLITASGKKLFSQFNWHLADKLLIGAEEAFFVGNRELNDQLKHLLTGDDIEVEQKFGQRISMKSMHRVIMTSNHDQVISASDDERRYLVCDVSDKRQGDHVYFTRLGRVTKGEDNATLAAFMYELQTRDIHRWNPEQAARKAGGRDLARQKLLSLEPPLQWLLEQTHSAPVITVGQTAHDVGHADDLDLQIDQRVAALTAVPTGSNDTQLGSVTEQERSQVLGNYRHWAKTTQVRGAGDFTGSEVFWASIKRLLNDKIFPDRKLFRESGGVRWVRLPPKSELLAGFDQLLGGNVVNIDEDC